VLDKRRGRERLVYAVEPRGRIAFISFQDPQTGTVERIPYPVSEIESRFEIITGSGTAFQADSQIVRLVAEAHRLAHAYLFNPVFATETSLIDLLPHQLIAVYDHLLPQARLRFLLADDAGAGKTIMAGLYIREMLLRHLIRRVLIISPAGLVGNWERELRNLFRLHFRILSSNHFVADNPFLDIHSNLAIISVDTIWRDQAWECLRAVSPYDLVIFDEAHKLSAYRDADLVTIKTHRYELAEEIAAQGRHILLLTATPHMGKDDPYYFLWRLLEPDLLSSSAAFNRMSRQQKRQHLLRRMKEEMINFGEQPIYPPRTSETVTYPLTQGLVSEHRLYDLVTNYCQTHYDRAKLRNRSAAGLAMSVLQRRLASSTWALLRSLERRLAGLNADLEEMQSGLLTEDGLEVRQSQLPREDVRDTKTGDEEIIEDGQEEAERNDAELATATDARTASELRAEIAEVKHLARLAEEVHRLKQESKFERLWQALQAYPETKILIFTEHRDTMDFLVSRLEGLGYAGKVAQIHGGMDYKQRDQQAQFFRDTATYLVATEAAGEGINLQFCWLVVNYDIPWNPARLEQRMGRVHRYKQTHPVLLLNMVAENTREGRVLKVLLDKLEQIRKELGSDKVFDVIGQQLGGVPLKDLIFRAVVLGEEREAVCALDKNLTTERVRAQLEDQKQRVEVSEVRSLLESLRRKQETAEMRRMMPAYVRSFFHQAARRLGMTIDGDILSLFRLQGCPESVQRALEVYPQEMWDKLTFDKALALPPQALSPQAIYLHPGEEVFDAVATLFLEQYGYLADRGAVFLDQYAHEPYLFYLARVPIVRERFSAEGESPNGKEILQETMLGIRRYLAPAPKADHCCAEAPAHLLLELLPAEPEDVAQAPPALIAVADDLATVEAFVVEKHGVPALEAIRAEYEARLPERLSQLKQAYTLRQADLLEQRSKLKEAMARGEPAAQTKLRRCDEEWNRLDADRAGAEAAILSETDGIQLGPVTIYARALVLPVPPEEAERRVDVMSEAIALAEVLRYERALGSTIEDVSDPHLKRGFDLLVRRPDGSIRFVEVKGRASTSPVELTQNEWAQAANHRDCYWLYVVYDCAKPSPRLHRVPDPFGRLVAKTLGSVLINATDVIAAAEDSTVWNV